MLRAAGIELDLDAWRVTYLGRHVTLTTMETRILEVLLREPSVVRTREDLIRLCWPAWRSLTSRAVDVAVMRLRQKLEEVGPSPIRSVRGIGYGIEGGEGSLREELHQLVDRLPESEMAAVRRQLRALVGRSKREGVGLKSSAG